MKKIIVTILLVVFGLFFFIKRKKHTYIPITQENNRK